MEGGQRRKFEGRGRRKTRVQPRPTFSPIPCTRKTRKIVARAAVPRRHSREDSVVQIRLGHDLRRGRKTLNKIMDRAHAPRVPIGPSSIYKSR